MKLKLVISGMCTVSRNHQKYLKELPAEDTENIWQKRKTMWKN